MKVLDVTALPPYSPTQMGPPLEPQLSGGRPFPPSASHGGAELPEPSASSAASGFALAAPGAPVVRSPAHLQVG